MIRSITYDDTLYQLVPILPTSAMIGNARWEDGEETARNVWAAMLSAAPQPEANEPDQCRAHQVDGKWLCDCTCMYTKCKPVQDAIRFGKDSSIEPHLDGDIGHE